MVAMSLKYRLVHFVPDPFSAGRVPVAALLDDGRSVCLARAEHMPGADCLGGTAPAAALRIVVDALASAKSLDVLPIAVGPQAVLGPLTDVPRDVANPAAWLVEHILPRPHSRSPQEAVSHRERRTKRTTEGYQFFESYDVGTYVRKKFQPEREWADLLSRPTVPLTPISHWVGNPQVGLALMEPVRPTRIETEIREVYNRLAGYQVFFERAREPEIRDVSLYVYVLPGGDEETRHEIPADFSDLQANVIDTNVAPQRGELLDRIRYLGRRAEPPSVAN